MLSRRAVKILRAMKGTPDWMHFDEIQKLVPGFDYLSFNALTSGEYVDSASFKDDPPDFDDYGRVVHPKRYHISDKGLSHLENLENLEHEKWLRFRSWAALIIALLAMLVSAIALVKSW